MSDSLQLHGLQHARLPCLSPAPRAYSNSCPLCQWCHPTISTSVVPFSSRLQSFPASGSFSTSQFFTSGGQSIGVSASASVLPVNIQDWFSLELTGLCRAGKVQIIPPGALHMRPAAYTSLLDSASATAYTTLTHTPCQGSWLFLSSPPAASWMFCGVRMTSESLCGPEAQCDIIRTHTWRLKPLPLAEPWHLPFMNCLIVSDVLQIASCWSCQAGIFISIVTMRKLILKGI